MVKKKKIEEEDVADAIFSKVKGWFKNHHTIRKYLKYFAGIAAINVLALVNQDPSLIFEFDKWLPAIESIDWWAQIGAPAILAISNYVKHNNPLK